MLERLSAPTHAFLNLTNGCNLRCLYCSADSSVPTPDELSREDWEQVIDQMAAVGVFTVTVTGGEPLVRTDAFDLMERMTGHGLQVSLLTNGTLLKPAAVDRLVNIGVRTVNVSLDSTMPEVNDATRGEGAYDRAFAGVENLLERGYRPGIMVTVTRFNAHEVVKIARRYLELPVASVAFNLVADLGRQRCHRELLALGLEDLDELAERFEEARRAVSGKVVDGLSKWYELPRRLERRAGTVDAPSCLLQCGAARNSCAISAEGDVAPCNKLAELRCGNLREQTLQEIWLGDRMERVRQLRKRPTASAPVCAGCRYAAACSGGCRAEAYLHFGDLEAPDPLCRVLRDSAIHAYA